MRYIKGLTPETLKLLARIHKQSKYFQVRQRSHCIILSYQGLKIAQLMAIFNVSRNTIYNWLNAWEASSFAGLYSRPGRGRTKKLSSSQEQQIKAWVKEHPKQLEKTQARILSAWGVSVSKKTIKRILKSFSMGWYRVRRGLGGSPMESVYRRKVQELEALKQLEAAGEIELRYVDESGFCLTPYVPYAWQETDQKITIKSQQSKRLNVLGFLTRDNQLQAYTFQESINTDVVIACIDRFSESMTKKTVLVLDNSPIHQNNRFWDKEHEWVEKELEIFFLPTYSPHLNLIEIFWRFLKYQWLESDAYQDYSSLVNAVENILKNFGEEYTINFV